MSHAPSGYARLPDDLVKRFARQSSALGWGSFAAGIVVGATVVLLGTSPTISYGVHSSIGIGLAPVSAILAVFSGLIVADVKSCLAAGYLGRRVTRKKWRSILALCALSTVGYAAFLFYYPAAVSDAAEHGYRADNSFSIQIALYVALPAIMLMLVALHWLWVHRLIRLTRTAEVRRPG